MKVLLLPAALAVLLLVAGPSGSRAEPAAEPAASASAAPEAVPGEPTGADAEIEPEEDPSTPMPAGPKKKKTYRRSKLTRDEQESQADRRRLLLTEGEDKVVDLDFEASLEAKAISTGNPGIVVPQLAKLGSKRQIVFKPIKAGETTVTLRDADGTVRLIFLVSVTKSNLSRRADELRDLLKEIEGLEIRIIGNKIVLDGELLTPSDYARVLLVTLGDNSPYKDMVLGLYRLSPSALQILAKRIQEDINQGFAPNVRTRVVNGVIFLEGTVDNRDQASRAYEVAKLYLPEAKPGNPLVAKDPFSAKEINRFLVQNFILVNPPPQKKLEKLVRVTIHYVELGKDYNKIFSFKWLPGITVGSDRISIGQNATGTGASGTSFTATISNLFPKLQSSSDAGYARVLKTGTVIVRSGQAAELNETQEIPFNRVLANGQVTGDFVQVGLRVAVTPQIVGQSEDIQLDVSAEQKAQSGPPPIAGAAPSTSTHNIRTKIYVKSNESAAIAGVNSGEITTGFNKQQPDQGSFNGNTTEPLFNLLHSKSYTKKKSQFVVFVTPQIIENASDGTEDMKRNFRIKVK